MFENKKSFSVLSIVIIIVAAVLVGGIAIYQSGIFEETEPEKVVEDETADWNVYRNEDYGFEIKYPEDWEISEMAEIKDLNGILKAVIEFGPKDKTIKPLSLKVIEGTSEQFQESFPDFNMFGESSDEPLKKFYAFKSPKNNELRILLTDESQLLGEDDAEKNELENVIRKIAFTFGFLD